MSPVLFSSPGSSLSQSLNQNVNIRRGRREASLHSKDSRNATLRGYKNHSRSLGISRQGILVNRIAGARRRIVRRESDNGIVINPAYRTLSSRRLELGGFKSSDICNGSRSNSSKSRTISVNDSSHVGVRVPRRKNFRLKNCLKYAAGNVDLVPKRCLNSYANAHSDNSNKFQSTKFKRNQKLPRRRLKRRDTSNRFQNTRVLDIDAKSQKSASSKAFQNVPESQSEGNGSESRPVGQHVVAVTPVALQVARATRGILQHFRWKFIRIVTVGEFQTNI